VHLEVFGKRGREVCHEKKVEAPSRKVVPLDAVNHSIECKLGRLTLKAFSYSVVVHTRPLFVDFIKSN
jgi:hypothetical protein